MFHISLFLTGGYSYCLAEVLFRGYTHWSMFLLGGCCLSLLGALRRRLPQMSIRVRMVLGGAVITAAEFLCGVAVNLVFRLSVWDYSDIPGNLLGQVCPLFSLVWCLISLPAMALDRLHCDVVWARSFPSHSASVRPVIPAVSAVPLQETAEIAGIAEVAGIPHV